MACETLFGDSATHGFFFPGTDAERGGVVFRLTIGCFPLVRICHFMASHSLHWRRLSAFQTTWGLCPSWRHRVAGLVPALTPSGSMHRNRRRLTLSTVGTLPELNGGEFARALTPPAAGRADVVEARRQYKHEQASMDTDRLVFLDESGVICGMNRLVTSRRTGLYHAFNEG